MLGKLFERIMTTDHPAPDCIRKASLAEFIRTSKTRIVHLEAELTEGLLKADEVLQEQLQWERDTRDARRRI
jgi:hypothetical protein